MKKASTSTAAQRDREAKEVAALKRLQDKYKHLLPTTSSIIDQTLSSSSKREQEGEKEGKRREEPSNHNNSNSSNSQRRSDNSRDRDYRNSDRKKNDNHYRSRDSRDNNREKDYRDSTIETVIIEIVEIITQNNDIDHVHDNKKIKIK